MSDYLYVWWAHLSFWMAVKIVIVLFCIVGSAAMLFWCIAVIIGSAVEAGQERSARLRRRRAYQVGSATTPEITRAWLAAMRKGKA